MSNYIGSGAKSFSMSNGLTDVFINVLVLSGSRLAVSEDEKRLIVWLAERDQSKIGGGTVGFDVGDMPWNAENFSDSKAFLLNVIKFAEQRLGWEALDYPPNEKMLFPVLHRFAEMVSALTVKDVTPYILEEWLGAAEPGDPVLCGFPKCEKHEALLGCYGCQVCNN